MLRVYFRLRDLDFGKLMEVYKESNQENAEELNTGILQVEQDFYQYLNEVFFAARGAFYALCEHEGAYLAALRMEPYRDGLLLEALETHPDYRKMGYAKELITAVLDLLRQEGITAVYAHVHKRNIASLRTHISCGFCRISEQAVYIDGSVNSRCCTMRYLF